MPRTATILLAVSLTAPMLAQNPPPPAPPAPLPPGQTNDPYPQPIAATEGLFASMCASSRPCLTSTASPARMMRLVDETGTKRFFVNDMRGPIYSVSYDGKSVGLYLDINDPKWGVAVQSSGRERGVQNFAFHPDFGRAGSPGAGKFYTYTDTTNQTPAPDFTTPSPKINARHRAARVDGENAGGGHLRRRRTA